MAGHTGTVLCLAIRQVEDGRAVVVSGSKDHSLRVWEAPSGRCIAVGYGHSDAVTAVAFSQRAGDFIVSVGADRLLKVWSISDVLHLPESNRQEQLILKVSAGVVAHGKAVNTVAISPNNAVVCSGSLDKTAKVFELPSLITQRTLTGHGRGIWAVQFAPVDRVVATASNDKTIKLWALADGNCLKTLEGHTAGVLQLAFMTYGTQIMSCGADGLIKLWNISSSQCINTFDEHEDKIWAIAHAGENQRLMATGGSDSVLIIWEDTTSQDEEKAAQERHLELQKEQQLKNALKAEDFRSAGKLAFELKHPGRLLAALSSSCNGGSQQHALRDLVKGMSSDNLKTCLEYIRDWNTSAKHCHEAQCLLRAVLEEYPPKELLAVPGIGQLVEALMAYTTRHLNRIDRLLKNTFLVDYTLAAMNVLLPEDQEILQDAEGNQPEERHELAQSATALEDTQIDRTGSKQAEPMSKNAVDESQIDELERPAGVVSCSPSKDHDHGTDENGSMLGAGTSTSERKGTKRDRTLSAGQLAEVCNPQGETGRVRNKNRKEKRKKKRANGRKVQSRAD